MQTMTRKQVISELKMVENADDLAKLYYDTLEKKAGFKAVNRLSRVLENAKLKLGKNDRLVTRVIEKELDKAKDAATEDEALEHLHNISIITREFKYSKYVLLNENALFTNNELNYNSDDEFPKVMAQIIKAYKYID